MRFLDADLNAALWVPRVGERGFEVTAGQLRADAGQSVVAVSPVVPASPSVTIDVVAFTPIAPDFAFRVWLRAGDVPSDTDVACEVRGNSTETTLALVGQVTGETSPGPALTASNLGGFSLHIRMQPSDVGSNVLCLLGYETTFRGLQNHIDYPLGSVGFAEARGRTSVYMMTIYDRDDAQPFPF